MRYSEEISQAWKDPERRIGDHVPDHPAGEIELGDVVGGSLMTDGWWSVGCCPGGTQFAATIGCCDGRTFDCWPVLM